jgi:hypothetical protein
MQSPPTRLVRIGGILASRPIQYRPLSMAFRTLRINSFLKPSPRVGCAAPGWFSIAILCDGVGFVDALFRELRGGYPHAPSVIMAWCWVPSVFDDGIDCVYMVIGGVILGPHHACDVLIPVFFCGLCRCDDFFLHVSILLVWLWVFARCLIIRYIIIIIMSSIKHKKYQKKCNYFIRVYNY